MDLQLSGVLPNTLNDTLSVTKKLVKSTTDAQRFHTQSPLVPAGPQLFPDSQYVILGATGARRWKIRGWVGSCGPVSNAHLWEELLNELDKPGCQVQWVKVRSHVTIESDNEADRLAEQGRLMHHKLPRPFTPKPSSFSTPKAPKHPKPLQQEFSPLPPTKLFPALYPPKHPVSCNCLRIVCARAPPYA